MTSVDPSLHDRFLLSQRFRLMVNQYEVSTLGADEKSAGEQVCFVEQKRMKLKEDLRAFTDDTKTAEVFRIKAQQVWDPRAKYDVTDPSGQQVGQLRKVFGKSLLRSTWQIYDAAGNEVAWARERNLFVALIRRLIGLVPFIGEFLELLPIPYHFDYYMGERADRRPRAHPRRARPLPPRRLGRHRTQDRPPRRARAGGRNGRAAGRRPRVSRERARATIVPRRAAGKRSA